MTHHPLTPLARFLSMPAGDHRKPDETVSLAAHDRCLPSDRAAAGAFSHSRISITGEAPQETQYVISR